MGLSNIQWCDYTFNPWIGCRKVAPECKNCYAETLDINRFSKTMPGCSKESPVYHWGSGPRYRTSAANWRQPLHWNKKAALYPGECTAGHRLNVEAQRQIGNARCPALKGECGAEMIESVHPRVFCASLGDWLDDENVPVEWLADLLRLIHATPNLDWLLLTKRPQNFNARFTELLRNIENGDGSQRAAWGGLYAWAYEWSVELNPPANVWFGVSAGANQAAALAIPAKIHFLSCEPMLHNMDTTHAGDFSWVILGGESGKNARPCYVDWIREAITYLRRHSNHPAIFVKQLGARIGFAEENGPSVFAGAHGYVDGVYIKLSDSHGGDMSEWPEDLRVREFPAL